MAYNASHARYEDNPARQIAYSVWTQDTSKTVTELVPVIEAATGEKLAVRTVQDWRHRDQWEQRLARDMLAGSEVYVSQLVTDLRVAAPTSVRYLNDVVEGTVRPDAGRIAAAKAILSENRGILALMADALKPAEEEARVTVSHELTDAELLALALGNAEHTGDRGADQG
jgi:hypothetical protein